MNSGENSGGGRQPHPPSLLDNTGISRKTFPLYTRFKVIGNGKIIEVYEFTKPISINHDGHHKPKVLTIPEMWDILCNPEKYNQPTNRTTEYKDRNINRSRNRIRRLVQHNFDRVGKLVTLTFKDTHKFDITSLSECHSRFYRFIKGLREKYLNIRYVAVPEFQKRGAVHYHLLIDIPYVPVEQVRQYWGYGFLKINAVTNPALVGAYIGKYIGKALHDKRYEGHRCFYSSKNLRQPVVKYGDYLVKVIEKIKAAGFTPSYQNTYVSEWCGEIKYSSYNLYAKPPAPKELKHGS